MLKPRFDRHMMPRPFDNLKERHETIALRSGLIIKE